MDSLNNVLRALVSITFHKFSKLKAQFINLYRASPSIRITVPCKLFLQHFKYAYMGTSPSIRIIIPCKLFLQHFKYAYK